MEAEAAEFRTHQDLANDYVAFLDACMEAAVLQSNDLGRLKISCSILVAGNLGLDTATNK